MCKDFLDTLGWGPSCCAAGHPLCCFIFPLFKQDLCTVGEHGVCGQIGPTDALPSEGIGATGSSLLRSWPHVGVEDPGKGKT